MNPYTPIHTQPIHTRIHPQWSELPVNNAWSRAFQVQDSQSPYPYEIEDLAQNTRGSDSEIIQTLLDRHHKEPRPEEKALYTLISLLIHKIQIAYNKKKNASDEVFKYEDDNRITYEAIDAYEFESDLGRWTATVVGTIQHYYFDKHNMANSSTLKAELLEEALWSDAFIPWENDLLNCLKFIDPKRHEAVLKNIPLGQSREHLPADRFNKTKNARND
jgi:hypothetical protein